MRRLPALIATACLALPLLPGADHCGPTTPAPDLTVQPPANPQPPMLGIQMSPPSRRVIEEQGLPGSVGTYVHRVYPGTAAENLGIQRGDVITAINGRPVNTMTDLRDIVMASRPGDAVSVVVRRDGQDLALGGASYRPWPDSIPMTQLDKEAEDRYRDMQQRRGAEDQQRLADAEQRQQELARELQDASDTGKLAERMGLDPAAFDGALPTLADGSAPTMLPSMLLRLGEWRFGYGLDVDGVQDPARHPTQFASFPAQLAPGARLALAFEVSSEVF
jgi:membrane-associated protease RseP (regulator of RpoE activity)